MQANNNNMIKDLSFVHRKKALYDIDVVTISFDNEGEFETFFHNTLKKHATWIVKQVKHSKNPKVPGACLLKCTTTFRCDHYGLRPKPKKKGIKNGSKFIITTII
jgi:hypothetical protein